MAIRTRTEPIRRWIVVFVSIAIAWMGGPPHARAAGERTLQAVDAERTATGWTIDLRFATPLRYMGHSPSGASDIARIELRQIGLGRTDEDAISASPPSRPFARSDGPPVATLGTTLLPDGQGLELEIRFTRPIAFEVRQGSDLQALQIVLPEPAVRGDPRYEAVAADLMNTANQSLAAGKLDHAIGLYTRVLSMNAPAAHPEALEMLGLARERNGQRAHAKAEYERFLERHPDDPRAGRVRQRLQALTTASATLPGERAPARSRDGAARVDVHGSVLSYYSRGQGFFGDFGNVLYDSSWINDLFGRVRVRTDRFEVATSASGRVRLDFADDDIADDSRFDALLVEASERGLGWWGNVGRQRGDGGVIGRFDGARLGYRPSDRLDFQVLGGFPLATWSSDSINTARFQVGGAGQVLDVFSLVDVEVYGNYQHEADMTYRGAMGAELRHLRPGRTLVATLDYDAFFNVVNIATLLGNQQLTDSFSLNGLVEFRKSPIVTMGNALIGQAASSLAELASSYSEDEMKQLARDRSANSTLFSLGGRYDLNERFDLTGSFTASSLGSTEASGGVPALPSTGYDFGYFVQMGVRSLLMERDVTTFGFRFFDSDQFDRYTLESIGSYPVLPRLRLNPILRIEYVNAVDDWIRFVPRIRLDYTRWNVSFDLDLAYDWTRGVGDSDRPIEQGYTLLVGIRYDF